MPKFDNMARGNMLSDCGMPILRVGVGVLEDVLGLGLEAQVLGLKPYKSSKMSCPRLEDGIVF